MFRAVSRQNPLAALEGVLQLHCCTGPAREVLGDEEGLRKRSSRLAVLTVRRSTSDSSYSPSVEMMSFKSSHSARTRRTERATS